MYTLIVCNESGFICSHKMQWANWSFSDCIAALNCYQVPLCKFKLRKYQIFTNLWYYMNIF